MDIKNLQEKFEAEHGPVLKLVADTYGKMLGANDLVGLAMFNQALASMAITASNEVRQLDDHPSKARHYYAAGQAPIYEQ